MSNILKTSLHKNIDIARVLELVRAIEDPRTRTGCHPFISILTIAVCAKLGGANDCVAIAEFGKTHISWFQQCLPLPYGTPSHDTFSRIFGMIDPREMHKLLLLAEAARMNSTAPIKDENKESDEAQNAVNNQIVLDGKVLRALKTFNPTTLIRAFFPAKNNVLAQAKVPSETNEITTIPKVLLVIKDFIKGCICTIDAIGNTVNSF